MSVLDRSALEASPLADLHAVASELSIDGYRRLRRAELHRRHPQPAGGRRRRGHATAETPDAEPVSEAPARRSRRTRKAPEPEAESEPEPDAEAEPEAPTEAEGLEAEEAMTTRTRSPRGAGDAADGGAAADAHRGATRLTRGTTDRPTPWPRQRRTPTPILTLTPIPIPTESDEVVEGVVELLANGSGFVRVDPPDPSDDDVYISSAQVKRCELVSGDRISGPRRAPRRSERFASLIRIETINGRPAAELADGVRFDDLPAAFPEERLKIGSEDPTIKAIEWLTPFGKGSRVTIVGASRSGKSEALRRLVTAMADREDLSLSVVLAGVRPEEISEWNGGPVTPSAAVSFAASEDARNGAVEPAIDQARRLAARGADAVVFIDTLDGCTPGLARKALGAARNIVDGGSVTIIATASAPIGGETTVISLDVALTSAGRFPALDLAESGTMRPELLVGAAGAEAIAKTRAEDA